jgi:hypothetical protein
LNQIAIRVIGKAGLIPQSIRNLTNQY